MERDTPAQAADGLSPTQPAATVQQGMQLRILTGCHQGAGLGIAAGQWLRVGCDDDCDVLLSDCGLALGESLQVAWQDQGWSVRPMAAQEEAGAVASHALGAVAPLGQVVATVCEAHLPWQRVAQPGPTCVEPAPDAMPESAPGAAAVSQPAAVPACEMQAALPGTNRSTLHTLRSHVQALVGSAVAVVLGSLWAVWHYAPASAQVDARPEVSAQPAQEALSPEAQEQAVKDATLAIALVDPTLRLRVEPHAHRGVAVSGWVDTVEQFDRLAQALSGMRPLPRLAVRTASEVMDALADAGVAQGVRLQFSLRGPGQVQAQGVVTTPAQQELVLAQLRARAPQGIDIVDGLRVAALQGPAVQRWLVAQGLVAVQARWDGEQLVLEVDLRARQRPQLERLLASAQTPLSGIPFVMQTRTVEDAPAPQRLHASEAKLPFRIRSVVGGAAPYVVLADGTKLLPGAGRGGWRLAAIAPDHLVFDGPQRLEVRR